LTPLLAFEAGAGLTLVLGFVSAFSGLTEHITPPLDDNLVVVVVRSFLTRVIGILDGNIVNWFSPHFSCPFS